MINYEEESKNFSVFQRLVIELLVRILWHVRSPQSRRALSSEDDIGEIKLINSVLGDRMGWRRDVL